MYVSSNPSFLVSEFKYTFTPEYGHEFHLTTVGDLKRENFRVFFPKFAYNLKIIFRFTDRRRRNFVTQCETEHKKRASSTKDVRKWKQSYSGDIFDHGDKCIHYRFRRFNGTAANVRK